jgi:polyphenol oxidase
MMFDKPAVFEQFPELIAAQSTRLGGFSPPPYSSLNLGLSTADDPENVAKNRLAFFTSLGITEDQLASSGQVHGNAVLCASHPQRAQNYDAIMTSEKGLFTAVTIADCCPVLIYDPVKKSVASIHAGWRGTVEQIVRTTLEKMMLRFGTDPKNCFAYVGTCISEKSFEVDADVAHHFTDEYKRFDASRNKFFIDLKKANRAQLLKCGVPEDHIEVSTYCTVINNDRYFSYRNEGQQSGRMLAVIGMR